MNDLKVFKNSEFGELSVLMIDGKEYFPATQCARVLGYAEPAKAVRTHCKGVSKIDTPTNGGIQAVSYIPEGDLYRLIIRSKLPTAEKFERWVFDEVLPTIRRTGSYGNINIEEIIAQTATAVVKEVVKQLLPLISKGATNKSQGYTNYKQDYRVKSKIEMLPPNIKIEVDEMLSSGQCSAQMVANYIWDTCKTYVSQPAVSRYKRNYILTETFDDISGIQLDFFIRSDNYGD